MSRAKQMFTVPVPDIQNRDGYPAYKRSLEEQYIQTLMTNTLGNTYYADKQELLQEANQVHDEMLEKDPVFVAKALPYARKNGYMRLQPIFGLAKLSAVNPEELFKQIFRDIILIPSDLQDFMTILEGIGRGQGGRAIKTAISNWLNASLSEYWAIKYNGRGRGFSLGDIVKTIHPKSTEKSALYKYLVTGEVEGDLPQIRAFEELKKTTDPESQIRLVREGRLPHEVVTGATKMTPELWNALVPDMPAFALLRHLNALDRAGVLDRNRKIVTERLTNPEVLAKSKILPFRFLTAFYQVEKAWVKDVLRQAVELTFRNLPEIPGKTAVFLDISGSMSGEYLRIGSVFALALYKKTGGNGVFWTFDTEVYDPKPSLYDSILTQAEKIRAMGGTDTGAPVRELTAQREKVDNIIIITDEQQNTGSPFYRALKDYRNQINPGTKAFIIDIAPYRSAMVPETDKNIWYIYGWSDQVLQFISCATTGFGSMVDAIKRGEVNARR